MSPAGNGRTRGVAVLGSTGSIGESALRVLDRQRDHFRVVALTAGRQRERLLAQVAAWHPAFAGIVNGEGGDGLGSGVEVLLEAVMHPDVDIVLNALVGAAGLDATLAALRAGKRVALANKESLVMAGDLVAEAARQGGGELVPVDSEHSAVLQCVTGHNGKLARLILTASGGPFRGWDRGAGGAGDGGAGAQSPDVAHGEQDHGGQCHAREQGARGDRGALPVRPVIRPGGRRRASAEHRACLRGVL